MLGEALLIVRQIEPTQLGTSSASLTPTENFQNEVLMHFWLNIAARILARMLLKMLLKRCGNAKNRFLYQLHGAPRLVLVRAAFSGHWTERAPTLEIYT